MKPPALTVEELLVSPAAWNLPASAAQRAWARVIDGRPLGALAECPGVLEAFGVDDAAKLPSKPPTEFIEIGAIRCGKTLRAGPVAIRATQTVDVRGLRHGETPRYSIVSRTLDLSRVAFGQLVGHMLAKPALRALLLGEPTADALIVRHPSGLPIEIKCVPVSSAGASLVGRWSAGALFDEAARMNGEEDGSLNFDDMRDAVIGRLLPGAQVIAIGSPWAPRGPIFDIFGARFGKPTTDLVVMRAPGWVMHPTYWTPERCEALRTTDPDVYRTDVEALFADPDSALLTTTELARVTRDAPYEIAPRAGLALVAAMDPATRGNAWTAVGVVVEKREGRPFYRVAFTRQWKGARVAPLSPDAVLAEIARLLRSYGTAHVWQDQASADANRDLARRHGLQVIASPTTSANKLAMYEGMRALIAAGQVELSPDPALRADLLSLRRRLTPTTTSIVLPTSGNGRHADYAPSLALALSHGSPPVAVRRLLGNLPPA